MKQTLTQTIETRIPAALCVQVDAALSAMAEVYCRAKHTLVSRKNNAVNSNKKEALVEFGLTGRQFNALKGEVDGLFQSQLSNYERYIAEAYVKIGNRTLRAAQIPEDIFNAHFIEDAEVRTRTLFKLHRELAGCQDRNNRAKQQIAKWQKLVSEKQISVCFGSKKHFKKQFYLAENDFPTHADWLSEFRAKRADEFTALGSKDETTGNQSCTIKLNDNGLFNLRLRLPNSISHQHGVYVDLADIPFNYRSEKLLAAIESNALRAKLSKGWEKNSSLQLTHQANLEALKARHATILARMEKRGDKSAKVEKARLSYQAVQERFTRFTKSNALCDFGQALSYRFKRDSKGWRIIVSLTNETTINYQSDRGNGAIGIDLNEHHLAITEIDKRGGMVQTQDIYFRDKRYGDSSEQTKSGLGNAIRQVIDLSVATGKPIVIENLDFKSAKAKVSKGNKRTYNRMISSLVTGRFLNIIKLRCAERNIELIKVNAAYTSLIGRLKYNNQVSFNVHQAAAMVIARRGLGFSDRRLPKQSICLVHRTNQMLFHVPEDTCNSDAFGYHRKVREEYVKWYEATLKALRAATKAVTRAVAPQFVFCEDIPQ
jgi:IS605 OrfB family transposase